MKTTLKPDAFDPDTGDPIYNVPLTAEEIAFLAHAANDRFDDIGDAREAGTATEKLTDAAEVLGYEIGNDSRRD